MSAQTPVPSRFARALLRLTSSVDATDAAIGDVFEELEHRTATGRAPRSPGLWVNLQVVRFATAVAMMSLPRAARALWCSAVDAARSLRRQPAHALVILLVLGTGISAATVTFTVVDAVLFRPLKLDQTERVVSVRIATSKRPRRPSKTELQAIRGGASIIDGIAEYTAGQASATVEGVTQAVQIAAVSPDFFPLLRLTTQVGRAWTGDDLAGSDQVAVISDRLWRQAFGGDPGVLGRQVSFSDGPRAIVGVLTPDADAAFAEIGWRTQVLLAPSGRFEFTSTYGTGPIARLRPGATVEQATANLEALLAPLAQQDQAADPAWAVILSGWRSTTVPVERVRDWMLLVLGAVGFVVLIACVNAATVMLIRSTGRAHELAIRASLGASRLSLAAMLLAESLLLSTAAGIGALLLATWGLDGVRNLLPAGVPRVTAIALDGRVFGAAMLAVIVTGLSFGAIPAWEASRASVTGLLKDGGTTSTGRRRWRSVLLVTQVSCVAVLLVLSTLFVGSFVRVASTDLGLDRSNLLAVSTVTDYAGTVDDVKARLARLPGVTGVAAATYSSLPLVSSAFGGAYGASTLRLVDGGSSATVKTEIYRVSSDYFSVAGIAFSRGATWTTPPSADWRPIVLDDGAARELFGDENPLGRIVQGTDLTGVFTVVGVVRPVLTRGPEGRLQPAAYTAIAPNARPSWVGFFVRTAGPAAPMVATVEAELATLAKPNDSAGSGVRVVDDAYDQLTSTRRFTGMLMGLFALIQMLIGVTGIYAVTASLVVQQTREFGVRIALGATATDIQRSVLGRAVALVLVGLAIGLPVAWWISRGFSGLFFQVQPSDFSVYLIVSALLLVAGVVAAAIPARRAARLDPIVTLRS